MKIRSLLLCYGSAEDQVVFIHLSLTEGLYSLPLKVPLMSTGGAYWVFSVGYVQINLT